MLESTSMSKVRLDKLLLERGLVESRERGRRLIMAGEVRVAGEKIDRPSRHVDDGAVLEVVARPRFVSRGGEKLLAALHHVMLDVSGKVCADVGSSTGGFTDCMLQHGAARVYAIDVGKGLLHWKLRNDPRVIIMEKTNARHLKRLPERVSLVTIDASFISLRLLLPVVSQWLPPGSGSIVALIKPQFEAGREHVRRGGVVRDQGVIRAVVKKVVQFAMRDGLRPLRLVRSPLLGPAGNVEFLAVLAQYGEVPEEDDLLAMAGL